MVLRLDHSDQDFATRFDAFLTTKREVSADVNADVTAQKVDRFAYLHQLQFLLDKKIQTRLKLRLLLFQLTLQIRLGPCVLQAERIFRHKKDFLR